MTDEVIIEITESVDDVEINIDESQEVVEIKISETGIPPGGNVNQVLTKVGTEDYAVDWRDSSASNVTWILLATSGKFNGTKTNITNGQVLNYDYQGSVIYRFITSEKTGLYPTEDSFYNNFDGTILSNLIITR